ncbi:MAG: DUF2225 domain-containing protein [Candidatus Riflebacteria bacterium]|nr:DUF2225 domain-containing protein [Candidatus Riflebacteria bacterium]
MLKRIMLFILLFVLVCNYAFATRTTREEITCPLCGTKFMATVVLSTNNFGGTDHDLCPHAVGYTPLEDYIWGCPYCNFCGYSGDFKKEYSTEEKTKIQNWLKDNYPPTIEKPNQEVKKDDEEDDEPAYRRNQYSFRNLPAFKRYEIAAELAKLAKGSNYDIGKLYLRSTWCARANYAIDKDGHYINENEFSQLLRDNNRIIDEEAQNIERMLDPIEARTFTMADFFIKIADNIEKREVNEEEKLSCYSNLAVQLRCSGENTKAESFIKKAEKCKDAEKLSALFEGLRNSIKLERSYQVKVIEYLSASLNDNLDEFHLMEVNLLLGEMNRRIEKYDEAKKYYSKLLENPESLPEQFLRTVRFATAIIDGNNSNQQESFEKIEVKRINTCLEQLSSPIAGENAARYLRFSKRRDIIYPKLVEIINSALNNPPDYSKYIKKEGDNKFLFDEKSKHIVFLSGDSEYSRNFSLEYAIEAMSDETEEAAKYQYALLDKVSEDRFLLENLKQMAHVLPSEKFIQKFNNASTSYDIAKYAVFLRIIGDKPSFEAIMAKAEKMLDDEGLKNLALKEYPEKNREACEALVESLALFRGKRTIDFLLNLCERIKKIHNQIKEEDSSKSCSDLCDLYKKAGIDLEIMFFRHFGFSSGYNRKHEPKVIEDLLNYVKIVEEPLISFKEWYAKYGNEDYKKIIYGGFKKYGYEVFPVSDPQKLRLLVEGLEDSFPPARIQCYKELVRRTGIKRRPDAGLDVDFVRRDARQSLIGFYNQWLEENISKLVYDEKKQKFVVKQ